MNEELKTEPLSVQEQLNAQQQALTEIYKSVEKTRKIMLWSGIASLAFFVLPLIVVAFAFPFIIKTFTGSAVGFSDTASQTQTSTQIPSLSESLNNLKSLGY